MFVGVVWELINVVWFGVLDKFVVKSLFGGYEIC